MSTFRQSLFALQRWRLVCLLVAALCLVVPRQARANGDPGLTYFQHGQFAEAFQTWRAAADAGDAQAGLYLGALFDTGLGVQQDSAKALDWYKRAAAAGSATAMFNVGVMYDSGRTGRPDPAAAADWYGKAAARGQGRAEYDLALLYEAGLGVPRDDARAVELFRAAASHGIAAARDHLARLGRPYAGIVKRLEDPGMRDFQLAQRILLARGATEAAQAIVLFRRAAQEGNSLAEYDLGYCYEHGIGVPVDPTQAAGLYRHAAAHASDVRIRALADTAAQNMDAQVSQTQR